MGLGRWLSSFTTVCDTDIVLNEPQTVPQSMGKSVCLQLWLSGTHTIDGNTAIVLYLCLLHVQLQHSYKKLYLILDNGSLTFTGDPHEVLLHKTFSILVYNLTLSTLPSLLLHSFHLLFPSPSLPSPSLFSPSLLSPSLPSPYLPSLSLPSLSLPSPSLPPSLTGHLLLG